MDTLLKLAAMSLASVSAAITLNVQAITIPVAADTYIDTANGQNTRNFGNRSTIDISSTQKAFLKFDLSVLPGSVTAQDIQKASLLVFINSARNGGGLQIRPISGNWAVCP